MVSGQSAEPDLMCARRIIIEIHLGIDILDARGQLDRKIILGGPEAEMIIVINKRGIGEKLAVEHMVPAQRAGGISPGNIGLVRQFGIVEAENIATEIAAEVKPVLIRKTVIHLGIQVVEIVTRTVKIA